MLKIDSPAPSPDTLKYLRELSLKISNQPTFGERVELARDLWRAKLNTREGKAAFVDLREALAKSCRGIVRCGYCEDSAADEIEHIAPKTIFPVKTFDVANFLFCCGPCNGPKGNKFGYVSDGRVEEILINEISEEPDLLDALVNPLQEDPLQFLRLDMGGQAADRIVHGTFRLVENFNLSAFDVLRAGWTIEVLDLNRDILVEGRKTAFAFFCAALRRYRDLRDGGRKEFQEPLARAVKLGAHQTVLAEIVRQRQVFPEMDEILRTCPEIIDWAR